jgi:hypothetical protein
MRDILVLLLGVAVRFVTPAETVRDLSRSDLAAKLHIHIYIYIYITVHLNRYSFLYPLFLFLFCIGIWFNEQPADLCLPQLCI